MELSAMRLRPERFFPDRDHYSSSDHPGTGGRQERHPNPPPGSRLFDVLGANTNSYDSPHDMAYCRYPRKGLELPWRL
jgi:hypothetical protein